MTGRERMVYLGIGSNVDAESNIGAGMEELRLEFPDLRLSPVYRTRAVGFEGSDFLNLAACGSTRMQPLELKDWLNALEARHGRTREVPKFSDRTLDIDILLLDTLWLRLPGLTLPRPEILHFAHVLRPLADLAPGLIHPQAGQSMQSLWEGFRDKPSMERLAVEFLDP